MEQLKILIVDDEQELLFAMAQRLELRGFDVEAATSGTDALRLIEDDGFSVLILDVKMPGVGGLELMAQIRDRNPDIPVILFTGHSSVADAEKGMRAGAFDYLIKPIDIDALIQRIGDAVEGKESHNDG